MSEYIISPNGYVMVTLEDGGTHLLNQSNIVSVYFKGKITVATGHTDYYVQIHMANMKADCEVPFPGMEACAAFIKELTGIIPQQYEPRPVVGGFSGPR